MGGAPRIVLCTRPTPLTELIRVHGTLGQARFFLRSRDQDVEPLRAMEARQTAALARVKQAVPVSWRSVHLDRAELSRFVFEPDDVVVAVGQDGLVANVAKYLDGQRVIGVNPDPERVGGALVRHSPDAFQDVMQAAVRGHAAEESRTMVEAQTDDGQRLCALNEIFVGHRTHQSARYEIARGERRAPHSSSGLIVASGTGATGWARSIARERDLGFELPSPEAEAVAFLVREAWPSVSTSTELTAGRLARDERLRVCSRMNDGGVLFGDGIEADAIELRFGMTVALGCAARRLRLVV